MYDVFVVYIDLEINVGFVYLLKVLKNYCIIFGNVNVWFIVCGLVSNGFFIVDLDDLLMMDIVGFDFGVLVVIY